MGEGTGEKISGRPPGLRDHSAAVARAGAGRRLAAGNRDPLCRRFPRHGAYPRARSRDLLHDVQFVAGRQIPRATLRHHAVPATRRRRSGKSLPQAFRRAGRGHHGRQILLGRGRVPGRLRQRADGADQRRLLRGPRRRQRSEKFSIDWPPAKRSSPGRRSTGNCRRRSAGATTLTDKSLIRPRTSCRRTRRCSPTRTASSEISTACTTGA